MALINKLDNTANVLYNGSTINTNTVETLLLLPPTLLKTVDKLVASIGEVLTYTVTITNVGLSAIANLPFTDVLPVGSTYVTDSFTLNATQATPTLTDNTLTFTIPNIEALGTAVLTFQVTVVGDL